MVKDDSGRDWIRTEGFGPITAKDRCALYTCSTHHGLIHPLHIYLHADVVFKP